MKINHFILSFILGLVLCSCTSKHELHAAGKLAKVLDAKSYQVRHFSSGHRFITELNFEGVPYTDTSDRITSYCAYYFFKVVPPASYRFHYDSILISMTNKSSNVKRAFSVDDMCLVDTIFQRPVHLLFSGYRSDSTKYVLSHEYLEKTSLQATDKQFSYMDSLYGNVTELSVSGYKISSMMVGNTNVKTIFIWVKAYHGQRSFPYYFGFFLKNKMLFLYEGEFNPRDSSRHFDFLE